VPGAAPFVPRASMSKDDLPTEVQRFVLTSVPSVPFLEGMLLLRSAPGATWEPRHVSQRLYVPEPVARELLVSLQQAGFAAAAGANSFRYAPSAEVATKVDQLAHWYAVRLLDVSMLIHGKLDKRAQHFADAFRWKKEG
jgi:hypothetical protein